MNVEDINSNEYILEPLIERALVDTMIWTVCQCTQSKPQEPDYVAALSTKFTKSLYNILVAVFPGYDFSVSGVYCHQKPIVDANLSRKVELGDILFVYADRRKNGEKILNSLLLQAKISQQSSLQIKQSEMHQLELYKRWPEFAYCRAGYLNGVKRNILPKTINDGAQYLLIDNNPLTNGIYNARVMFPMGCAVPDDNLFINDSLSKELINLLKFKSGRTFDSNPYSTEDDWSKMIWDLLRIAAFKNTKRKNVGLDSFSRNNEYDHFCIGNTDNITLLDEALGDYKDMVDMVDEGGAGVSVVLIESRLNNRK